MKTKIKESTRFLLVAFAVMFSVTLTQAQQGGQKGSQKGPPLPNDKQINEMVADLSTELSLSETQKKQVSEIYFVHFDEVEAVIGDGSSKPDREVMGKLKNDFEKEVKSVLTKDQQKEFDAYMKKKQSQRGGKPKH